MITPVRSMVALLVVGTTPACGDDDPMDVSEIEEAATVPDAGPDAGADAGPEATCSESSGELEEVVGAYGEAWGETDEGARLCLLSAAFADGGTYEDPMGERRGIQELSDSIGNTFSNLPSANVQIIAGPEVRGNEARFAWSFRNGEADLASGEDFVQFADDGRFASVNGFFGPFGTEPPDGRLMELLAAWNEEDDEQRQKRLADVFAEDARVTTDDDDARELTEVAGALQGEAEITSAYSYGNPVRIRAVLEVDGETTIAYVLMDTDDRIARMALFEGEL